MKKTEHLFAIITAVLTLILVCGDCTRDAGSDSHEVSELLSRAPAGVAVAGVAGGGWMGQDISIAVGYSEQWQAMLTALSDFTIERLGVDLNSVSQVSFWLDVQAGYGLFIPGTIEGELQNVVSEIAGRPAIGLNDDFFLVQVDDGLLAGTALAIENALQVNEGSVTSLVASTDPGDIALLDTLRGASPTQVVIAVQGLLIPLGELVPGATEPQVVTVTMGETDLVVRVRTADSTAAAFLVDAIEQMIVMVVTMVEGYTAEALESPNFLDGYGAIFVNHLAHLGLEEMLTLEQSGADVVATLELSGDPTLFATIGILASVAIPAFIKYIRRSKTTEALENIRRLYDMAVVYYDHDHVRADGTIIPPQFPASVSMTPADVPCGDRSEAQPSDWTEPTWQALNFAINRPHYYSYQFNSSGEGVGATFTASAFGDLDCDGVFSTFVRSGEVILGNEVRGFGGVYQANELE